MAIHHCDEYWLYISAGCQGKERKYIAGIHQVIASLAIIWLSDADGTFIRFQSRADRETVARRIREVLPPGGTMLLGQPETPAMSSIPGMNDNLKLKAGCPVHSHRQ